MTSWPTPQDYNEAIQTPAITFADPELKNGAPELSILGLPRPITGAFASVYKFHGSGKDWAIRCFLRESTDLQTRYQILSQHIPPQGTAYTAAFQFFPQGLTIRQNWYPILKMEWLDGVGLERFIEQNLDNPEILRQLADKFRSLTLTLRHHGLAHGDLQHGNVMVMPDGVRIVDYDGFYAPELAGTRAAELGHANYQHPLRTVEHFGPYLDNFSAWIIYASIMILTQDKTLWQQLNGGDECILFRRTDYANPVTSYTFSVLEYHPSQRINFMAKSLRSLLRLRPEEVPALDAQIRPFPDLIKLPEPSVLKGTQIVAGTWSESDAPAVVRSDWPKAMYFEHAVTQPNTCFKDRELRRAHFGALLPTGKHGFVCVLKTPQRNVAVKCFLKEVADREVRYHEIKRALASAPALKKYVVDFEYQREGIVSRGKWYPIAKIEYVPGPTMDEYLIQQLALDDRDSIVRLITQFQALVKALQDSGIAHGDLEPKNIIVTPGGLKLIDYDSMYVPSLTGLKSCEFGEPLYQHPARSLHNFGVFLHNYPAWVIDNTLAFFKLNPDTFHWGWDCVAQLVRSDEMSSMNYVSNETVEPVVVAPVVPELKKRAHLMSLLQEFPVEQVPPLFEEFSSNLLKREELITAVTSVLQQHRPGGPG